MPKNKKQLAGIWFQQAENDYKLRELQNYD